MSRPVAHWHISLDVVCPLCGEEVDLTDLDWIYECLQPAQTVKDYEFDCPKCRGEFRADTEY